MLERLNNHWIFCIHVFSFNFSVVGQVVWFLKGLIVGASLSEMTYILPCVMICLLGEVKVYFFLRHIRHVNELVTVLRYLESKATTYEEIEVEINKWQTFLFLISKLLLSLAITAVLAFALGPFVIMGSYYYSTGEVKLYLPFLVWYPFDAYNIRVWPIVFLLQLWAAWVAVFSVLGPDCFFFTCCTFIHIQFRILQRDIKSIVKKDARKRSAVPIETFKAKLVLLVNKHRELLRTVNLLEIVYSKSTLFNVGTSSLVICATGFNLMAIKNLALMAPFTSFLIFGLLQIFLYCYYGDYVMRSSMGVGAAVYNSRWYETGAAERKYLLIVLIRSQKPCRIKATALTVINLITFTRILSTSWSYFALLNQMYND